MEYIGDAIQRRHERTARASGTTVDAVQQYQSLQAQSIVANKRAEYMRQRNSLISQIQGDTTITPDQWNDKWLEQSSELADYYGRDDNPVANRALQQMVSDGNEEVRSRFENTKAQWYKNQARVTCANGIQSGIDAGDLQQINDNLMTFEPLADSPQQMEQAKATAADSYLMKTGFLQLEQEMKTNGKATADAMLNHSDYSVVLYNGETRSLTPALKGQLKEQLDSAWSDFTKANDEASGMKAMKALESAPHTEAGAEAYKATVGCNEVLRSERGIQVVEPRRGFRESRIGKCRPENRGRNPRTPRHVRAIMPKRLTYRDACVDAVSRQKLSGGKLQTALGYWKRGDADLEYELKRINTFTEKDKSGKQLAGDPK